MSRLVFVISITINFALFFGCTHKERTTFENKTVDGKPIIIKKTYDKKGYLIIEELLDKDSIRNGYYKEFISEKIKDSGNYYNGQKEGIWHYLDLNGDIIKIENWFSGKQFGEEIDYYLRIQTDEQPQMYKYSFYKVGGRKIFESKFDINKNLISMKGTPIYCVYNDNKIDIGDSYELICFFGVPQGFKWDFSIKEKEKNNRILFEKNFTSDSLSSDILNLPFAKKYLYTKKYFFKGEYNWRLFLQIKSLSDQILFKDSLDLNVLVQ